MEAHRDNGRYIQWNLENTARLLHTKFPRGVIFVIKPSDMLLQTFSVYKNFVECEDNGSPNHHSGYGGLEHLTKLYQSLLSILAQNHNEQSCDQKESHDMSHDQQLSHGPESFDTTELPTIPVSLIGFSKGCVVLNQLLYELDSTDGNPDIKIFIEKIKAFYWLDGGHAGGSNTWINKDDLLDRLTALKCKINVYATPYQVQDEMRKWIGKEEKKFVEKLKRFKADITETRLFMQEPGSIENHFKVLEQFNTT